MVSSVGGSMVSSWANSLFSKLDTKNQGYLEKSDLQSAFSKISDSSSSTDNIDNLFSQLDGDSNGKVTKDEMTSALQNVFDQLTSQANSSRMHQGGMGGGPGGMNGMPPPPPPQGGNDAGFTKDELTSQLNETGTSDSKRSELINKIVSNFDKADSDGDGKVSMKEAMAYDQSTQSSSSSTAASSPAQVSNDNVLKQIMQLMQAYQVGDNNQSDISRVLSISA